MWIWGRVFLLCNSKNKGASLLLNKEMRAAAEAAKNLLAQLLFGSYCSRSKLESFWLEWRSSILSGKFDYALLVVIQLVPTRISPLHRPPITYASTLSPCLATLAKEIVILNQHLSFLLLSVWSQRSDTPWVLDFYFCRKRIFFYPLLPLLLHFFVVHLSVHPSNQPSISCWDQVKGLTMWPDVPRPPALPPLPPAVFGEHGGVFIPAKRYIA